MNNKTVSIIIPCYNSAQYLVATLDTVKGQSYSQWECLIVDDGSVDDTESIANLYVATDARFHFIKKKNEGVSATRNVGIKLASGAFIQFLDSDDLMGPEKLTEHVAFLERHANVDIVYSGSRYFNTDHPEKKLIFGRGHFLGTMEITMYDNDVLRSILIRNPFITSAPLYRKQVFDIVGVYDETMRYLEDWDFQVRCAANKMNFHYTGYRPETAIQVRLHATSLTTHRHEVIEAKRNFFNKHQRLDTFDIFKKPAGGLTSTHVLKMFIPPIFVSAFKRMIKAFSK